MPRPGIGNPGNRGRGTKEQEALITEFKGLVLADAIKTMKEGTKEERNSLVIRAINAVLPRTIEGVENGFPIKTEVVILPQRNEEKNPLASESRPSNDSTSSVA